ncbi:MAG: GreA/GreB family elongation factor, partial [Synergistaceae bacterium]|nr:GreA/GreB family elongation factor [Synergistaceae bacterium]
SQKSPVGQAVLGHAIGEEVIVRIPRGTRRLRIMAIEK